MLGYNKSRLVKHLLRWRCWLDLYNQCSQHVQSQARDFSQLPDLLLLQRMAPPCLVRQTEIQASHLSCSPPLLPLPNQHKPVASSAPTPPHLPHHLAQGPPPRPHRASQILPRAPVRVRGRSSILNTAPLTAFPCCLSRSEKQIPKSFTRLLRSSKMWSLWDVSCLPLQIYSSPPRSLSRELIFYRLHQRACSSSDLGFI